MCACGVEACIRHSGSLTNVCQKSFFSEEKYIDFLAYIWFNLIGQLYVVLRLWIKEKRLMASEMLKAVLEAEEECSAREAEAKKQAEADKQKAKQQASELVAEAQRQSEKMLSDNEKALGQSSEAELQRAREQAQAQCSGISRNAEKNIGRVKKLVVDMLTASAKG